MAERTPDDSRTEDSGHDNAKGLRNRRRVLGWLPASSMLSQNKSYRAPGSAGGRKFLSTEHLATEAVAAYVDGELRMNAYMRASQHLQACSQCRAEVEAQSAARAALRRSGEVNMPAGLLGELSQIPTREIDIRMADGGARDDRRVGEESPLDAPGFPVHRGQRRRNR
ncbi:MULTISPECIES: hypothetical protein [Mycobacteriales]|uniref:RNA polymerase subunit sigma-70 n=1 Tax=Gordonia rubripertincta TaxID=36822 RepID=A0ABT4N0W5_GORRU|nr:MULTISPECIES: hypothetical protein [Mycobacteriales]MCZ4552908.1 hypothetical protein [Gordonia rubripertincta]